MKAQNFKVFLLFASFKYNPTKYHNGHNYDKNSPNPPDVEGIKPANSSPIPPDQTRVAWPSIISKAPISWEKRWSIL